MSKDQFIEMLSNKTKYIIISDKGTLEVYKKHFPTAQYLIEVQNSPGLGHNYFCSTWIFDKNGAFIAVSHYED